MHLHRICSPLALLLPLPLTLSAPLDTQTPLSRPSDLLSDPTYRVPTRYESTILGRRLLALSTTGVISTIFPSTNNNESTHFTPPPPSVASLPVSLPDYLSDCDNPSQGNPTLLFLDPSTSSRNSRSHTPGHNNNISLSCSWWEQYPLLTGHRPWAPVDLPRLSMIGYLQEIPISEAEEKGIVGCYLKSHPDARLWLPGDRHAAHGGRWVRMVVQEIYWIGGFGDRHWIGWFDREEWKGVERWEWEGVRLPGEE